ncbi:MAG TPA: TadE family protein [Anaerolineales bacterium]|nr:TadE family protein [Anaerolineales bacterium]
MEFKPARGAGSSRRERGQALAETALVLPILFLLMAGMMLAGFYAFRAAAADFGVFVTGAASGAFDAPLTGQARAMVLWPDIRAALRAGPDGSVQTRAVKSQISILDSRAFIFGIRLREAEQGSSFFRLWRFYPGPPTGGVP